MPPLAATLAVPLVPPGQVKGVEVHDAVNTDGVPTIDSQVAVQPFASVTVTV